MTPEQKEELADLLKEYTNCFAEKKYDKYKTIYVFEKIKKFIIEIPEPTK